MQEVRSIRDHSRDRSSLASPAVSPERAAVRTVDRLTGGPARGAAAARLADGSEKRARKPRGSGRSSWQVYTDGGGARGNRRGETSGRASEGLLAERRGNPEGRSWTAAKRKISRQGKSERGAHKERGRKNGRRRGAGRARGAGNRINKQINLCYVPDVARGRDTHGRRAAGRGRSGGETGQGCRGTRKKGDEWRGKNGRRRDPVERADGGRIGWRGAGRQREDLILQRSFIRTQNAKYSRRRLRASSSSSRRGGVAVAQVFPKLVIAR